MIQGYKQISVLHSYLLRIRKAAQSNTVGVYVYSLPYPSQQGVWW